MQSMPSKRAAIAVMNGIAPTSGMNRSSTALASGPCNASRPRSSNRVSRTSAGRVRFDVPVVELLSCGIDDQQQAIVSRIGGTRDHQVVENAAVVR